MKFDVLFTAIEEMTQQLDTHIEGIVEQLSGENIEDIETQAMLQMREAEVMCFNTNPVEALDNKTISGYIADLEPDMFLELLSDPMLYLVDLLPDAVEAKVASYKGTEYAPKVAAVTKRFCTINFDSQSTEVATALKLYSACGDEDLFDIIFRLNEASFRMVEQGDADWELVQDAVVAALHNCQATEICPVVVEYIKEASVMTAMHTPLLRYIVDYPEWSEDAYSLLKRGVKESQDRPFLLELFARVGNHRAISFIKGFISKNPALVDRLFLTEAVRAVTALEGDPNDLIELYQKLFANEE